MYKRFARLRQNEILRNLVCETTLSKNDLIYPLFVTQGTNIKKEIKSMPNIYKFSIDRILIECEELEELGLTSIILFADISIKDSIGSEALCDNSLIAQTIKAIKKDFPNMFIVTDLCFCEYTDHGHCGVVDMNTKLLKNDLTLELLVKQALIHIKSGANMIAPSGMLDGMIKVLRDGLDKNGYEYIPIMSYSTKFASSYYGPFRDAVNNSVSFGNRKTYQMNITNRLEAINESLQDEKEGADILMVKPALAFMDIIRDIRNETKLPLAVYNVSGEYSMIKYASLNGIIDYKQVMMETLIGFKRAGANIIISYHAKDACKYL